MTWDRDRKVKFQKKSREFSRIESFAGHPESGHLSTFHLSVIVTFTFSTSTFRLSEIPSVKVNVALNKEKSCRFDELSKSHARWSSWKDWFRTNQIKEREKSESEKVKIKIIADLQLMPSWNRNLPGLRQLICLSGCFRWQQMWISELSAFDISVFFCIIVNNKLLQLEMFDLRRYQSGWARLKNRNIFSERRSGFEMFASRQPSYRRLPQDENESR